MNDSKDLVGNAPEASSEGPENAPTSATQEVLGIPEAVIGPGGEFNLPCDQCPVNCCKRGRAGSSRTLLYKEEIPALFRSGVKMEHVDGHGMTLSEDEGRCTHLRKEDDRCEIYENRPLTCRSYPLIPLGDSKYGVSSRCPQALTIMQGISEQDPAVLDWVDRSTRDIEKYIQVFGVDITPNVSVFANYGIQLSFKR